MRKGREAMSKSEVIEHHGIEPQNNARVVEIEIEQQ
jgi:hypothetical protein